MIKFYVFTACCVYLLLFPGCRQKDVFRSPAGYDLSRPEKFVMPESLLEISGICFRPDRPDTIYAVQDEEGRLFRQRWGVKAQKNSHFAGEGDYEDVAYMHGYFYVLKSNGVVYRIPDADAEREQATNTLRYERATGKGEYEGLFADPSAGKLYLLCKNCKDDKAGKATGYVLHPGADSDSLTIAGTFEIKAGLREKKKKKNKPEAFRPSALERHPVTGAWYILSSFNKVLLIADQNWTVQERFDLDGSVFNQPEGIAFDAAGNLYISNEGSELEAGNILKFTLQR